MTVEEQPEAPAAEEETPSGGGKGYLWPSLVLALALILSLVFAALAPALAPTPGATAASIPPLPAVGPHPTPPFRTLADHFPYLDRSAGDPASRRVLTDLARSRLLSPTGTARMFIDAWHALSYPRGDAGAVRALEVRLITDHIGTIYTAGNLIGGAADPSFAPIAAAARRALRGDPANAGRLNNAATALYLTDAGMYYGRRLTAIDGVALPALRQYNLQSSAGWLWDQAHHLWPANRAAELNVIGAGLSDAPAVTGWLKTHPDDPGAVLPAAGYAAYSTPTVGSGGQLDQARALIRPLLRRHATAALGYAALADIDLDEAQALRLSARYQANVAAHRALDGYDRAIALSGDPAAYNGRAQVLEFLGNLPAAEQAQRMAVRRATDPLDNLVRLGYLQQEAGDIAGMQRTAQQVLAASEPWHPRAADVDFGASSGAPLDGTLSVVYSDTPYIRAVQHELLTGGGGSFLALDSIPRYDSTQLQVNRITGSSGGDALSMVAIAGMLAGDPARVAADAAAWGKTNGQFGLVGNPRTFVAEEVTAAGWLRGSKSGYEQGTLLTAENNLRVAGRFAAAFRLCSRFQPGAARDYVPWQCAGESQFFVAQGEQGNARLKGLEVAAADLRRGAAILGNGGPACGDTEYCLEAATAEQVAGLAQQKAGHSRRAQQDIALARRTYGQIARQPAYDGSNLLGQERLADLDFLLHHRSTALAEYARAQTMIRGQEQGQFKGQTNPPALFVLARSSTYNNTGIALLERIQASSETRPDCAAHAGVCRTALADFERARSDDPGNPIFALNVGWANRLLGREEEARGALESAVAADPTLYPALNDLGVIELEAGETDLARQHLQAALAANPHYDLAAWNLGVLHMRQGPAGVPAGQAYLARATAENRALRGSELEPRTDERTYTYLAGADIKQGGSLGRNYSIGAAAFGWIALLAALYQAIRTFLTDKGVERVADWWDEHEPEWRKKLAERMKKAKIQGPKWVWRSHPTWKKVEPWAITIPVLAFATALATTRVSPGAVPASLLVLAFATGVAILTHETGHLVAADLVGAQLKRAYWTSGVSLALVLSFIPLEMNTGPYLGHEVEGNEKRAWQVYLGGPLANLVVGAGCYALYLAQPLPLFRLMTQVQLAICAYSLLPIKPLDGEELEHKPRVLLPIAILLTAVSIAFVLGLL